MSLSAANDLDTHIVQMYVGLNGEERTLGSFIDVTESSKWKITQVYTIPGSSHKQILAVPV